MISENQIISIYCDIYDFCKELDGYVENGSLEDKYIGIYKFFNLNFASSSNLAR
ncbi:hypothetical protein N3Z17_03200 [Candidatus Bandiella numerosa]|jgi:hypothetical protein|uniref:hypothetical protein n=1 Tax=Candidatus Bandiella numerosa TaxID=2570586 RepID=UPI00249F639E|nr:hypothetical protein [Candidatus Bandiella numerosa]WHA05527.1 hypothetical protein N3Z17_03200 [Candidatus Bandiella numerosa]